MKSYSVFLLFIVFYTTAKRIVPGCRLVHLDRLTSRTTIHLWHELHVGQNKAHDFEHVLKPCADSCYLGVEQEDMIHAIALCQRINLQVINVIGIAHHPQSAHMVAPLITLSRFAGMNWSYTKKQQRVFYEAAYILLERNDHER